MNKKFLALLYASRFLGDFVPIAAYSSLYFLKQGISIREISILFFVWTVSLILFEIPTGILADKVNRKAVMLCSRLAKMSCFVLWFLSPHFSGFIAGFILWGLASALDSGTFQAFLYDELIHFSQTDKFHNLYGKATSFAVAGLFLGALCGSLFVSFGFSTLFTLAILSLAGSFILLCLVPNHHEKHRVENKQVSSSKLFLESVRSLFTLKLLFQLVCVGIFAGGIKASFEEFYPLYFQTNGIPLAFIGFIIASVEVVKLLGVSFASRFQVSIKKQIFILGIVGLLFVLAGLLHNSVAVLCILALTFLDGILWVNNDSAIQKSSDPKYRATIASIKSFGLQILIVIVFGLVSLLPHIALGTVYLSGGIFLLITGAIFYLFSGAHS